MEIVDIRYRGDKMCVIKRNELTSDEVKAQAAELDYENEYRCFAQRDPVLENTMLPPFIYAFYSFSFKNDRIPTPSEFMREYLEINRNCFETDESIIRFKSGWTAKEFTADAFSGRMYRAYPSILRDFHFFLMLTEDSKETDFFSSITYSCDMDRQGSDIIVIKDDVSYTISLFTNTANAHYYKEKKNTFRHDYSDRNEITVPLDLNNADKAGSIFLYPKKAVSLLKVKVNLLQLEKPNEA